MFEGDTVADESRVASVDFRHLHQREILFAFLGRADDAVYHIACLQAEEFDLRLRHIDVVRRGEIVIIRRAEESITILHDFQYAGPGQDIIKVVGLFRFCRLAFGSRFGRWLVLTLLALLVVSVVVGTVVGIVVRTCDAGACFFGRFGRQVGCIVFGGLEFANQLAGEFHVLGRQVFDGDEVVRVFSKGEENILDFFLVYGLIVRSSRFDVLVVCRCVCSSFRCFNGFFRFYFARTSGFAFGSSGRRFSGCLYIIIGFHFSLFLGNILVGGGISLDGFVIGRCRSRVVVRILFGGACAFLFLHLTFFFQFFGSYFFGCSGNGLFIKYFIN